MTKIKTIQRRIQRTRIMIESLRKSGTFDLNNGVWNDIIISDHEARINKWNREIDELRK